MKSIRKEASGFRENFSRKDPFGIRNSFSRKDSLSRKYRRNSLGGIETRGRKGSSFRHSSLSGAENYHPRNALLRKLQDSDTTSATIYWF